MCLLAGMVAATLSCLGVGAKFVEIGKRDIFGPHRVAQERPDVQYHLLAIDFLPPQVSYISPKTKYVPR